MFRRRATDVSNAVTKDASVKNARQPTRRARAGSECEVTPKNASKSTTRLTISLPNFVRVKGIMKYVTEDESMHSKYGGESKEGIEAVESKQVVLKDIQIREYARTIGDNPSCSSGPPISIDWQYSETEAVTVDEYETNRAPRRTNIQMVLPRTVRQSMLKKEWDVSQGQIAAAVRSNIKIKNQRRSTVNNLGKASKMEEMMENAGKKVLRGLMFKKGTSKELEDLEKQYEEAEKRRSQTKLELQMADEYDDDIEDIEDTLESNGES